MPSQDTSDSDIFYQWLLDMILYAINVRKNTRPPDPRVRDGHEGSMTQFGISEGSRSARQIGYAKSYKTKLTHNDYRAHDEDANAAGGIFWSLARSSMPTEVIDPVVHTLQENHIPHLASNFVAAGKGYRLQLGEAEVIFPEASRAPPELYLTRGYSA
ncbi:hypothetical protein DFJ43DRAFT_1002177 [Lentinula guzmanii]|uniref:Uncharacterized protein n=2 Tax=Lentinula TaxID=5352 RepID=A0AA38MY67_9AGAR|nr:hypothetical protein DFJ43DRAFT_1002177 [Lentinula guzmanii]